VPQPTHLFHCRDQSSTMMGAIEGNAALGQSICVLSNNKRRRQNRPMAAGKPYRVAYRRCQSVEACVGGALAYSVAGNVKVCGRSLTVEYRSRLSDSMNEPYVVIISKRDRIRRQLPRGLAGGHH
jgi:hypothetical protein